MKLSGSNQSVEKTIRIIEMLAMAKEPMRLSEMAKGVGMPPSTVLRMINTLVELGYAYQEEEEPHRYGLTIRFLRIGQMAADHFSIRDVAHPYLIRISRETGESSCLSIEDHYKVRYIDVTEGSGNLITIRQRIGGSGMMHCTGSGKLFLSQYQEEQLDDFIREKGIPGLTSHTLTTKPELMYELESCRRLGYATDDEECEIGMRCIAAPICDSQGKIIAAISISGPISRMTRLRNEKELAPMLCEVADKITQKMVGTRIEKRAEAAASKA